MLKRDEKVTIWAIIIVIVHIIGFISSIHALMSTRSSQGTIAWCISLNMFPIATVPAYWILGRNKFNGYVTAKRMAASVLKKEYSVLLDHLSSYRISRTMLSGSGEAAEKVADLPFLSKNEVELLIDGQETFKSITVGIEEAKQYVLFQFYIISDDELGRHFKQLLIKKAREGVKVYVLYDEIGSFKLSKSFKNELKAAGVQAYAFNTRKGPSNRFQINFRNHRKVVVVDGKAVWIGGHNVGDEYLGKDPKFGYWRDTHVKIVGPAALAGQLSFWTDWHWATNQLLKDLNWEATSLSDNDISVLTASSGPADSIETASLMFLNAINSSQKRIWIQSPYFVPDQAIISALQLAALRGVDVRILIPDSIDHLLVWLCAFSYFGDATATGAKIYRYTKGFLHAKTMLVDDDISAVGTANMDNRSLRLNFEITAWMRSKPFAKKMEKMYLDDFANARLMTDEDVSKKPWWFKIAVRFARLTAPIQ